MSGRRRVAIVGGGIAGLATAYHLEKRARERPIDLEIRLFEAGPDLGGVIRTERIDGYLLDTGPDALFRGKPAAAALAREIGLGGDLVDALPQELPTLIWSRGRLRPLPAGLELVAPTRILPFLLSGLISMPGKLRMAMEPLIPARRDGGDESVAGFVRRRLGDEAARKIAGPLLAGIHAGDPERLSIWSTFSRLPEMERDHGSVAAGIRAARARRAGVAAGHARPAAAGPPFTSLRGGLRTLIDGLAAALHGTALETSRAVAGLERSAARWRLALERGEPWEADAVVVAIPAPGAAALLRSASPGAASALARVRYASSATVFLGYRAADLPPLPAATGFLIPAEEGRRIFGCTLVSNKFPGRAAEGRVLIRAFVGGALDEEAAEQPDGPLIDLVRGELRDLLGIAADPEMIRIGRWTKANPQYEIGHRGIVEEVDRAVAALPGLVVTGSGFRGVGIPDGVAHGREAADQVVRALAGA